MTERSGIHAHTARRDGFFRRTLALAVLLLLILLGFAARSQPLEYLLKGGFLEKFARFTDWPETKAAAGKDLPFIISIIGDSPFEGSLEELYAKEKIKNRPVRIRYIKKVTEIDGSDILFVAASEKDNLENILAATHSKPILVIGDTKGFGARGCHINFYITTKGTVHFEINLAKVKESALHMQLVLLEVAKIID